MAGIYIHIPFCSKACHYCDFHFSTNLSSVEKMVLAIIQEMQARDNYLNDKPIETVYFGGGTPSILSKDQIAKILNAIYAQFIVDTRVEITLEGNPDDITIEKIKDFKEVGINRLSIGVQTFDEPTLLFMNRSHSSHQAEECLLNVANSGFDGVSADLIFAVPPEESSTERLLRDLEKLLSYDLTHISLYSLTIEQQTVFGKWQDQKKLTPVSEDENANQFELIVDTLIEAGYEQYEVSNFAKIGNQSKHNSSYWKGTSYLGLGPSAHSYDGSSRSINVSNNARYLGAVADNNLIIETEVLSSIQQLNEYILTGIRTMWGIDLNYIQSKWGIDFVKTHKSIINVLVDQGKATIDQNKLKLNSKGFSIADELALQFFSEE